MIHHLINRGYEKSNVQVLATIGYEKDFMNVSKIENRNTNLI